MVGIRPLSLAFLTFALVAPSGASAQPTARIILKRDAGLTAAQKRDIRDDAGVRFVATLPLPRTELVAAPADAVGDALRELNADPGVVYAEPDRAVHAFAQPNDPEFHNLWALDNPGTLAFTSEAGTPEPSVQDADMDVLEAWDMSDGTGVTVAVLDTGVDATHPDLADHVALGWDFVSDDPYPSDPSGHGTHIAGTIAATLNNGKGIAGVAPEAHILPVRVLNATGSGSTSDIIFGYDYAADLGVRVINASFGGDKFSRAEYDAIARHPSTLFVAAAGNDHEDNDDVSDGKSQYPCAYDLPNIICVGASRHDDTPAAFSNYGDETVDLFAPGYGIDSTVLGGGYGFKSGTSMAAPHVASEGALLLSRNPKLLTPPPQETVNPALPRTIRGAILESVDHLDSLNGLAATAGRANAYEALRLVDWDGDGVADGLDNCPAVANSNQAPCSPAPADADGDGVLALDRCPDEKASYSPDGCPRNSPGSDFDYWPVGSDQCPTEYGTLRGCPDQDGDGVKNAADNCVSTKNPSQVDADRDGIGDICDATPRGPDADRDGKPLLDDRCPTVPSSAGDGCPVDRDGDGRIDAYDACPNEPAATLNGCPLPAVTALAAKSRKRSATVRVSTSRAATVRITVQRKRSSGRWVRVARRLLATTANRATVTVKRLRRGSYRAVVVVSSSAGRARPETQAFRVR
jgi:subtilisin family serine protease